MYHHPIDWDLRLNQDYYSDPTNRSLEKAMRRKLQTPRARDIQAIRISEMMLDRIPDKL